jgi:hypothetical protein
MALAETDADTELTRVLVGLHYNSAKN